jgi:S1-C subfamily serine protease
MPDESDFTPPPAAEPAPEAPPATEPVTEPALVAPPVFTPAPAVAPTASPRTNVPWLFIIALALIFGMTAGFAGGLLADRVVPGSSGGSGKVTVLPESTEEAVAAAAAAAVPSVVNIDVSGTPVEGDSALPQDHPDVPITGSGSGVAFRSAEDGGTYIVTNEHVVAGATNILVTTLDGDRHEAELVGSDAESDMAIIKVAAELPLIEMAETDSLVVGQLVVAIGSPFGLQHSVTSGVVSALHRSLPGNSADNVYPLVDVIQTDAAINPGNSGGALVDRSGKLVGIPSAIYSESGSDDGVGFAIPIKTVERVATELIESGSAQTPFLGIVGQTLSDALIEEEGLTVEQGAFVVEITAGTEAEKAGIKEKDVIVKLDETPIRSMDELILAVRRMSVGDTVTLTLYRDGEETTLEMKIGVKPKDL